MRRRRRKRRPRPIGHTACIWSLDITWTFGKSWSSSISRAPVEWNYSEVSRNVSLIWREPGWTVLLNAPVARKLGWPGRVLLRRPMQSPRRLWAPGVVNLDEVDLLYVHCDLAADSHLVGDKRVPLLAAVSVQGRMGEVVHYEPQMLDWLQVRSGYVSTIEVLITEGAGRRVAFEKGATLVKVHLRRRSPFSWLGKETTTTTTTTREMRHYHGALYQKGHGLGSIFLGLFKTAMALLNSAGRASGKVGLWTGLGVIQDAARGRNLGESLKRRLGMEVTQALAPSAPKRRKEGPMRRATRPGRDKE